MANNRHHEARNLTKHEAAAIAALQGIMASEGHEWHYNDSVVVARMAVELADKLFDELEKNSGQ